MLAYINSLLSRGNWQLTAGSLATKLLSILLNQFRNQRGPAGLVAGADAGAVVAMKVFVKRDQVAPVGIFLEFFRAAEDRAPAMFILQKYSRQALGDFSGDLPQVQVDARAGRVFDFEIIAEKEMKLLQRLDEQIIDREPDRTAPVGVAAKKAGARLRRFVIDAVIHAVDRQSVRMIAGDSVTARGCRRVTKIPFHRACSSARVSRRWRLTSDKKPARAVVGGFGLDVLAQRRAVFDKPLHAAFETRQAYRRPPGPAFRRRRAE